MGSAVVPLLRIAVSTLHDLPNARESPLEVTGPLPGGKPPEDSGAFRDGSFVNNVRSTWSSSNQRRRKRSRHYRQNLLVPLSSV